MGNLGGSEMRPPCPFYGFVQDGNFLMDIGKSNCGLLTPMLIPCKMKQQGLEPDFSACRIHDMGQERVKELLNDFVVFPDEMQPENGGLTGIPFEIWADMISPKTMDN
jgi:hypothetical protein